jgi:hypothetical protein
MVFEFGWGQVAEAAVTAPPVVEGFDVFEGHELCGGT